MRILFTADPEIPVPPVDYGGVQRLVDGLIREFRARGHTVGLAAHPDSSSEVDSFTPLPGRNSQIPLDAIKNTIVVWQAYRDFNPDILHSFSRLLYMLPLMRLKLPKLMTYGRYPGAKQISLANQLAGDTLGFTGCSNHIVNTGRKGGGNWKTVYNYVELDKLTFEESVDTNAPLVFLSRIEQIKGVHTAIEIAQKSGSKLIIAGNLPDLDDAKEYWQDTIKPKIDGEQIEYVGPVNDQEKNTLLGSAKALVVPIEWEEPFGMVFTEALACGTPVISTHRGAVPEIITHGREGFIINNVDEGVKAIGEISTINRAQCRSRVEEMFKLPIIADQYYQFYEELIERASK